MSNRNSPAWLGAPPADWPIARLSFRYHQQLGKMLNPDAVLGENQYPYLANKDVQWGRVVTDRLSTMTFTPAERSKFNLEVGDLLVCEGGEVGRTAIWLGEVEPCYFQKAIHRLRPTNKARDEPKFLYYALVAATACGLFEESGNKSTISHLTGEALRAHRFPFPDLGTQQAIADYLDLKTAAIDALIEKKQKLLDLLAEKRAALINQAVTKGLDPNVPMKDSGIPWIGVIPTHWHTAQLRRVVGGIQQGWSPECESRRAIQGEWGVLKAGCTAGGLFRPDEHKALPGDLQPRPELEVKNGDIIVSRASGSPSIVGSAARAVAPPPHLILSDKLFRIIPDEASIYPEFLVFALGSRAARAQIENAISGAEGLANNLPQARLKEVILALPPVAEQRLVSTRLGSELEALAKLAGPLKRSALRLSEYRQALITAAVTGQLSIPEAPTS